MKQPFEKEFDQWMTQRKPVSSLSRQKFDAAYRKIRQTQAVDVQKKSWQTLVIAAMGLIVIGAVLTSPPVIAKLQDLLGFNSEWKEGLESNLVKDNQRSVTNQGVTLSLRDNMSTSDLLGFSYQMDFADKKSIDGAREINFDYRIKNGDGDYLMEVIPDTKVLKGTNSLRLKQIVEEGGIDESAGLYKGTIQLISNGQALPLLKSGFLEVETIRIFYRDGEIKELDGQWHLPLEDGDKNSGESSVPYVVKSGDSQIDILDAKLSGTMFTVRFSVKGKSEIDLESQRFHLTDENGQVYRNPSYNLNLKEGKPVIDASLPLTNKTQGELVTLVLEGVGEVVLKPAD